MTKTPKVKMHTTKLIKNNFTQKNERSMHFLTEQNKPIQRQTVKKTIKECLKNTVASANLNGTHQGQSPLFCNAMSLFKIFGNTMSLLKMSGNTMSLLKISSNTISLLKISGNTIYLLKMKMSGNSMSLHAQNIQ